MEIVKWKVQNRIKENRLLVSGCRLRVFASNLCPPTVLLASNLIFVVRRKAQVVRC
jgi:hypothetical protein